MPTATGRTSTRASDPTSAAHENSGARCRRIPGARVVSTDVATVDGHGGQADEDEDVAAEVQLDHVGIAAEGPPLKARAMTTSTVPPNQAHSPAAAAGGRPGRGHRAAAGRPAR